MWKHLIYNCIKFYLGKECYFLPTNKRLSYYFYSAAVVILKQNSKFTPPFQYFNFVYYFIVHPSLTFYLIFHRKMQSIKFSRFIIFRFKTQLISYLIRISYSWMKSTQECFLSQRIFSGLYCSWKTKSSQ